MSFPVPTTAHFIYIPFVLMIGFVVGFIFGGRAARDEMAARAERDKAKAERRAAREAAREAANKKSAG